MMPTADLIGNIDQRFLFIALHLAQHGGTDQRMFFHLMKFFYGQSSRLVQDFFVNPNFSDIMKR